MAMPPPYQVLGDGIPRMLGRQRVFRQLCDHLTKPTPDHVSVVGPTLFGKSVLLNHLASWFETTRPNGYLASLYWDLRFGTPGTDEQFRSQFAEKVRNVLLPARRNLAVWLEDLDDNPFDILGIVLEELADSDARVLVVLDGFDHLLRSSGITKNLWDQLREIAQQRSLWMVTGSRKTLRELCHDPDSRTSYFWNIF